MSKPLPALAVLSLCLLPACRTFESADLTRYAVQQGFPVTSAGLPPAAVPLRVLSMQEDGFYLFAWLPVVRVSLQGCLDRMVAEARRAGADGIAGVEYRVDPPHLFRFTMLGLPDWTAMVRVVGTAYRHGGPTAPTAPGGGVGRDAVRTAPAPPVRR